MMAKKILVTKEFHTKAMLALKHVDVAVELVDNIETYIACHFTNEQKKAFNEWIEECYQTETEHEYI